MIYHKCLFWTEMWHNFSNNTKEFHVLLKLTILCKAWKQKFQLFNGLLYLTFKTTETLSLTENLSNKVAWIHQYFQTWEKILSTLKIPVFKIFKRMRFQSKVHHKYFLKEKYFPLKYFYSELYWFVFFSILYPEISFCICITIFIRKLTTS